MQWDRPQDLARFAVVALEEAGSAVAFAVLTATGKRCRVLTNLGEYQESKHLHWHVCAGEPLR